MKGSIIMSFASEIKKELSIIDFESLCCTKAELAALIRMNGVSYLSKDKYTLDVQTENAAIARRMYRLIKEIYVHPVEILVRKKMKLRKNNVYIVRLLKDVPQLLQQLQIFNKKNERSEERRVGKECRGRGAQGRQTRKEQESADEGERRRRERRRR